ncbi:hypothetical protein X474_11675 [Dethiosulfatarculus sandiegensis]|uniref:Uncharacterized protein n=1 Tax=Dethiosulfatarculus sandiegensis TaxID=1429043 RepID=A0A0D2GG30_9BACT|nr:hypothetical protein X474_11675 [Dethiosulfatarculus sandiegensis]
MAKYKIYRVLFITMIAFRFIKEDIAFKIW